MHSIIGPPFAHVETTLRLSNHYSDQSHQRQLVKILTVYRILTLQQNSTDRRLRMKFGKSGKLGGKLIYHQSQLVCCWSMVCCTVEPKQKVCFRHHQTVDSKSSSSSAKDIKHSINPRIILLKSSYGLFHEQEQIQKTWQCSYIHKKNVTLSYIMV